MVIDPKDLTRELHFPVVRGVVEKPIHGFFDKVKRFLLYRRKWQVMTDYIIWSDILKTFIFIPASFIFDGASVPKLFHNILGPTGLLLMGSCPHDFGYHYKGLIILNPETGNIGFKLFSKATLDDIFMDLCRQESSVWITSWVAEKMVQIFGIISWLQSGQRNVYTDFSDFFNVWCSIN